MTRQRKMIELVLRSLRDTMADHDDMRVRKEDEYKIRVLLACAVDTAIEDLTHALSPHPCNHGACINTRLDNGSPAHYDQRAQPHPPISGQGYTPGCSCLDCREREEAANAHTDDRISQ